MMESGEPLAGRRSEFMSTRRGSHRVASRTLDLERRLRVLSAELTSKQYEPAAESYRAAAEAAQRGEIAVLALEARRLEGTCWLLAGQEDEAIAVWQEGL